jgi:hypothetical protein
VRKLLALLATALLLVAGAGAAQAAGNVTYKGQGLTYDGTTWSVNNELCGIDEGAEVDGPYLLWILTATKSQNATITIGTNTYDMKKTSNGTFKYVGDWVSPGTLVGNVSATYDGNDRNPQLTISHGCAPYTTDGAWCSPGYWRNASDASWALTGYLKTALFNNTVVPTYYDTASGANPTLIQVLTTPGANTFGAASDPFGLNAFNATGAFLTDQIPGYHFDPSLVGVDEACPIDNHGNFKN